MVADLQPTGGNAAGQDPPRIELVHILQRESKGLLGTHLLFFEERECPAPWALDTNSWRLRTAILSPILALTGIICCGTARNRPRNSRYSFSMPSKHPVDNRPDPSC